MKWQVGDSDTLIVTVSEGLVGKFQAAVLDFSRLPEESDAVLEKVFGGRVVHGVIPMSFVSSLLGNQLPGPGGILLGQSFRFKAPVFVGDVITASATIREIRNDKPVIALDTVCTNQKGETVLEGEAHVLFRERDMA
ncbi:MAG: MaoC family dehydratase [bacterium]